MATWKIARGGGGELQPLSPPPPPPVPRAPMEIMFDNIDNPALVSKNNWKWRK